MSYQNITVEMYQAASPAVGERLFDDDMLKDIYYVCEELFQKRQPGISYPKEDVEEYFEEYHTVISFFRHIEIILEYVDLNWIDLLEQLVDQFPQLAWVGGSKEQERHRMTYYFDFVPIAYHDQGFPFVVNLQKSLAQQLMNGSNSLESIEELFINQVEEISANCIQPIQSVPLDREEDEVFLEFEEEESRIHNQEDIPPDSISKQANIEIEDTDNSELRTIISDKTYENKQIQLINQKLEILLNQIAHQTLQESIRLLAQSSDTSSDGWDKVVKIDLREYTILIQKAKFLEQTWLLNKELITKNEKMTISDNRLTYEREQIHAYKQTLQSSEIYLVLEECKLIESRVKFKKKRWFRQPSVCIMQMDYDSLKNKATYFDLIQGENQLLESYSESVTEKE